MLCIALLAPILAGCVTQQAVWDKPGGTQVAFDQDKAQCIYEAKLGTPSMPYHGMSGAISTGIEEGMRQAELEVLCMQARGYTRRTVQQANAEPIDSGSGAASEEPYWVQVSSQRSEAEAQAAFKSLQLKFPEQLRNRKPIIMKISLAGHGVFYRANVGPFTTGEEAADLCGKLKTAGGQCLIQHN